jgi:N-acetylmuramoyl-L-alanine amidase
VSYLPGAPGFLVKPEDWGARFASRYDPANGRPTITPCTKLIVHHSASNQPPAGQEAAFSRQIESYGEGRDGAAIEYNYLVYPTGVLHGGFGDTRGCHAVAPDPSTGRAFNSSSIGICFIGFFHQPYNMEPTAESIEAFQAWLSWMVASGRLTDDVITRASSRGQPGWYGHRDVGATACPGDDLYPLLPSIIQIGTAPAPIPTPTPPQPSGDDDMPTPCGFIQCNAGTKGHHVDGSEWTAPVNGTTFKVNPGGTIQWVHAGELDDATAVLAAAGAKTDTWDGAVGVPDAFGCLVGDKPYA